MREYFDQPVRTMDVSIIMSRSRKKRFGYPEPGAWPWREIKGMPKVYPPEPLPEGKLSDEEVKELIAYEGLGECLFCLSSGKLQGAELRKLWVKAQDASRAIVEHLEKVEQAKPSKKPAIIKRRKPLESWEDEADEPEI